MGEVALEVVAAGGIFESGGIAHNVVFVGAGALQTFLGIEAGLVRPWARHFGPLQLILCIVKAGLSHVEARLRQVLREEHAVPLVLAHTRGPLYLRHFVMALAEEAKR